MKVLFRVDASVEIGSGHVMRCLILAEMLRKEGCTVNFLMRKSFGDLCDYVEERGFPVSRILCRSSFSQKKDAQLTINWIKDLNEHFDWCIVDHYQIDQYWEERIKEHVGKVMVIDDLANRLHACHLLLDQNYYKEWEKRYLGLVPPHCRLFLGPEYLILRPEFYEAKKVAKVRNGEVRRILIFFGASDPTNETEKVLKALKKIHTDSFEIDIVVGSANRRREKIQEMCYEMNMHFHCQIDYIATLMANADLSIGAGGVTMWERCFLGLPSIVTIVADNQKESVKDAVDYGAIWSLGHYMHVNISSYVDILNRALVSSEQLTYLSNKSLELMGNNQGNVIHPVVRAIMEG